MLLSVEALCVMQGDRTVLREVSLEVASGEVVALLGANGSGKTTMLKSIIGLCRIGSGAIRIDGKDVVGLEPSAIIRRGVAIVPENRRLFPRLTVEENLLIVLRNSRRARELEEGAVSIARLFPVLRDPRYRKQLAGTLSGGEQQQVAMARALMLRPRLILLDEPSMGMSVKLVEENFRIVRNVAATGVGVLIVEQNVRMVLSLAARGYVLREGQVLLEGESAVLLADPTVRHAYMGEFV